MVMCAAMSCGLSAQTQDEVTEAKADSVVRKTETREVENFTQVEIDGLFNVRFVKGEKSKVELSSERMANFDDVKVVCKSGILVMEYQNNMPYVGVSNIKRMDLDVTITTPAIERLKCSGVVSFETEEALNGGNVRVSLNGVSNIRIAAVEGDEDWQCGREGGECASDRYGDNGVRLHCSHGCEPRHERRGYDSDQQADSHERQPDHERSGQYQREGHQGG